MLTRTMVWTIGEQRLEALGFDTAQLNDGYGQALDFMLDGVIASSKALNESLRAVLPSVKMG
jgi:hypothetical protein